MNSKKNIDRLVEETLDSISSIDAVKTSPFFKDRVFQKMVEVAEHSNNDEGYLNWFTPQLQAAALICFIIVNVYALFHNSTDSYGDDMENFAEVYGLSETDTDSYFYQN